MLYFVILVIVIVKGLSCHLLTFYSHVYLFTFARYLSTFNLHVLPTFYLHISSLSMSFELCDIFDNSEPL